MDVRTMKFCHSLRRIIAVVERYPVLTARAAESKAFELFVRAIEEIETLVNDNETLRLELDELAARKKALINDIVHNLDQVCTTVELVPPGTMAGFRDSPPSSETYMARFTLRANAMVLNAERHANILIENGLHHRTFDDTRAQIDQLIDVDFRYTAGTAFAATFESRRNMALRRARKRRDQVEGWLKPVLTDEVHVDWKAARSLGRTHQSKLLPAPIEQKLLAAPRSQVEDEVVADSSAADGGIKRLARRVGLRLSGGETG